MKLCFRHFSLSVLIVAMPIVALPQDITNFSYKLVGEKIEILYHLSGQSSDRYKVELFNSLDNYKKPMELVMGDIKGEIIPGKNKKIVWEAKNELGEFKGGLALRLKTEFVPFIMFTIPAGEKYIMGKEYTITWQGDASNLMLDIYLNNKNIGEIGTVSKGQEYSWKIPKKSFKKGKTYTIKGTAKGRTATSSPFTIKKKTSVVVWLIPIAVAGGVFAILSGGSDGGGENPTNSTIPEPLGPD